MATVESRRQAPSEEEVRIKAAIEKKYGKTTEQLFEERDKRVRDTIALNEPDRVPTMLSTGVFACKYAGLPVSSMYYDHIAHREACRRVVLDFEPDLVQSNPGTTSGEMLEVLDSKHQRWPGGNLPEDIPYQFVEGEYMKAEEYGLFMMDPSDFYLRFHLPRLYAALAPLSKLPSLRNSGGGLAGIVALFATPEFRKLGETLAAAGTEQGKTREITLGIEDELNRLGFPTRGLGGGVGGSAFDYISDNLRGMRGAMLDMYRCPDKLLAACEKVLEWRIAAATPPKGRANIVSRPLHRGAEGFMSIKQFEKFYWPTLKKAVIRDVELGYIPWLVWQGKVDSRLEYFLELPKGKVVCWFSDTDMVRAKAILGNHICISGNVPVSMLACGTPEDIDDYCEKLINICGKGGGFILTTGGQPDDSKPENIKAMMDSVKKHNVN
ncbi:uroporphyrinogen decarboxylase family protein [Chloroflexota bacterium]